MKLGFTRISGTPSILEIVSFRGQYVAFSCAVQPNLRAI